jgi:hypothetical protein
VLTHALRGEGLTEHQLMTAMNTSAKSAAYIGARAAGRLRRLGE